MFVRWLCALGDRKRGTVVVHGRCWCSGGVLGDGPRSLLSSPRDRRRTAPPSSLGSRLAACVSRPRGVSQRRFVLRQQPLVAAPPCGFATVPRHVSVRAKLSSGSSPGTSWPSRGPRAACAGEGRRRPASRIFPPAPRRRAKGPRPPLPGGRPRGREAGSGACVAPAGSGRCPGTDSAPGRVLGGTAAAGRAEDADRRRVRGRWRLRCRNRWAREGGGFPGRRGASPRCGRRSCEVVGITLLLSEVTRPCASPDVGLGTGISWTR